MESNSIYTNAQKSAAILTVDALRIGIDTRMVVDGVDFTLHQGKTLGIVGESGSGKSMTALAIMQLLPQAAKIVSGAIKLNQEGGWKTVSTLTEAELCRIRGNEIALIFQEPMSALNPIMRCGNQIVEAVRVHQNLTYKEAKTLVLAGLDEVELPSRAFDAYPHQLSGGQKQRIMIAMAVINKPRVLIADEPTTALDVSTQKSIVELLLKLQANYNMGMVFISHDLGLVGEIADEVLIMKDGRMVEKGEVKALFSAPQHPYTRALLACRPSWKPAIARLPTIEDFLHEKSIEVKEPSLPRLPVETVFPLVRVKNLSVSFPGPKSYFWQSPPPVQILKDVSLEIQRGETLGLVGESGSGKTTLGRSILRMIQASSGEIYFKDLSLREMDESRLRPMRSAMQLIFQDPYSSLNPRMSIGKALMEPLQVHRKYSGDKERKDWVMALLEKVGLEADHYRRYPHQFSGGQRQRIVIARALALKPEFVVCDESVSALDVSVQAQVLNLLKDLQDEFQLTYLFISHDLKVIRHMSDRIAVMQQGALVEIGETETVCNTPISPYTQLLLEAMPKS